MTNQIRQWLRDLITGAPGDVRTECRRQGWNTLRIGRAVGPLCLAGKTYATGFGTHAESEVVLRSGRPMRRFRAVVGIDDNAYTRSRANARCSFSVEAGGRELWRSPALAAADAPIALNLALPGDTRELTLRVKAPDGNIDATHANWADATVVLGGKTVRFAMPHMPEPGPFSFTYGSRLSSELLPAWPRTHARRRGSRGETIHDIVWRDPATQVQCRLELSEFPGFPVLEWVLHFRNNGAADTPILQDVHALDLPWATEGETALFRSRGSTCRIDDFEHLREPLIHGNTLKMVAGGGRSSNEWLPFFNLQSGAGGAILAIGWSGQWAAEFANTGKGAVHMRAGMEQLHLTLHPGEEIRSPRILLLAWTGDRIASHNLLRRFLLKHHIPQLDGRPIAAPLTVGHWGGMKSAQHLERIAVYRRAKLDYDYYWVDAGWYGPPDSVSPDEFTGDWWKHVGNWTVNPAAHPNGLRPLADAAAGARMKFLLWFEPERAVTGTPWTLEHPDWFLGERKPLGNLLLDLGNPAARRWITDTMATFIAQNAIGLYRQDFNFDPLPFWRAHDTPDRQGMTEIRHVEGLYAFWDELRARCPGLIIDNCASGGRRIDLETISRSIPLWRSDWQCAPHNDPIGGQVHGMGLAHWVPLHGTGVWSSMPASAGDVYRVRSNFGPALMFAVFPYERNAIQPDYPWAWHRRMLREIRRVQPLFLGDYYPLTGDTPGVDQWAAYQMCRTDLGEGFVLAFRRKESPYAVAAYRLRGLDPRAWYELEDADTGRTRRCRGKTLAEEGLRIELDRPHTSRLVFYRKLRRKEHA